MPDASSIFVRKSFKCDTNRTEDKRRSPSTPVLLICFAVCRTGQDDCDDGDNAIKMIRDALGIESDDVANYVFPRSRVA